MSRKKDSFFKVFDHTFGWKNQDGPFLFEMYFISATVTVIGIRLFLYYTGYPKLGGGGLHIAHLLWGGLFMFVSQNMSFFFIGRRVKRFCALLGGVGFGFFIDEIGKFLTDDNDYFFQPTTTILYIIFCVCLLFLHYIEPIYSSVSRYSAKEKLANVLELLSIYSTTGVTKDTLLLLEELLTTYEFSDEPKEEPNNLLVIHLREYIESEFLLRAKYKEHRYLRIRRWLSKNYKAIITKSYSIFLINTFFFAQFFILLSDIIRSIDFSIYTSNSFTQFKYPLHEVSLRPSSASLSSFPSSSSTKTFFKTTKTQELAFRDILKLCSAFVSFYFILYGILTLNKNRYKAFYFFRKSLFIKLLVTNSIILYYQNQNRAIFEVILTLLLIASTTFIIIQEKSTLRRQRRKLSQASITNTPNSQVKLQARAYRVRNHHQHPRTRTSSVG